MFGDAILEGFRFQTIFCCWISTREDGFCFPRLGNDPDFEGGDLRVSFTCLCVYIKRAYHKMVNFSFFSSFSSDECQYCSLDKLFFPLTCCLSSNMFGGDFLVFYIIAVNLCLRQPVFFYCFAIEWVPFGLIYNLLPSYKICFPHFVFAVCLADFIKWIFVSLCVSLNLFLLTVSTWYILIYICWLWPLNAIGKKIYNK